MDIKWNKVGKSTSTPYIKKHPKIGMLLRIVMWLIAIIITEGKRKCNRKP